MFYENVYSKHSANGMLKGKTEYVKVRLKSGVVCEVTVLEPNPADGTFCSAVLLK